MNKILVTGAARSGTSLTAGIIDLCGAFGGQLRQANVNNKKGMFENKEIVNKLVKPYLVSIGTDPMGQMNLPGMDKVKPWPDLRRKLKKILKKQGWNGKSTWYYKGAKMCLIWPVFHAAFPDAKWIIVRRDEEQIIDSCLRTPFMRAHSGRQGWKYWIGQHTARFAEMHHAKLDIKEVWPSKMIQGDLSEIKGVIEWLGLAWNEEAVQEFVDPTLWNKGK